MKKFLGKIIYILTLGVSRIIYAVMFRFKVIGKEHFPKEGPFLIMANHASFLDPMALALASSLPVRWVVRKDVYHFPVVGGLCRLAKCIPLNGARKAVLDSLNEGNVVGVFPEGTRSWEGNFLRPNPKTALLILESGVPVVPVAVCGAFEAYHHGQKVPRPLPVEARVGEPLQFEKYEEGQPITEERLEEVIIQVMDRIKALYAESPLTQDSRIASTP